MPNICRFATRNASTKAARPRRSGRDRGDSIDWFNHRLHSSIGDIPPAEYEAAHYHAVGQLSLPAPD